MREKYIEACLIRKVKKYGGLCLKLVSPGNDGMPDRICLLPGGEVLFVELKALGKKPRPLQIRQMERLRNLGFRVEVADNENLIDELLQEVIADA